MLMAEETTPARWPSGFPGPPGRAGDRLSLVRAMALSAFLAVVTSIVLLTDLLPSNRVTLNAGEVSPQDIRAPADLTYESQIRTRQAQDAQAALVQEIYDPPDSSIARQQEVRARQILDYLSSVRQDSYASPRQKADWIAAIPDLALTAEVIGQALALSEPEWQEVREETVRVLVRAMQSEIRDGQVDAARRRVPTLISYSLTDEQAAVVEAIAGGLVRANTFFNAARTEEARQQARESTPPVTVTIRQGEVIVRAGDLVRPVDIEALDAFGLRQQATRWQAVAGTVAFALVATALLGLFFWRLQPQFWARGRASVVTFVLVAFFVAIGKLMLPATGTVAPYFYPLPALTMILTVLFGPVLGTAVGVALGLIGAFMVGGSLEMTVYLLAGALMGALTLGRAERLNSFLRAGLAVALTHATVILLFGLLAPEQDLVKTGIRALAGFVAGGLSASLALAAFFALSAVLDVITPFQLLELSRPTHPLFRQLLLKAPGTYHHTLLVSNMAEEAANRIGADGLLARVGAYYHDIGKTLRPFFFAENRVGGVNPHDRLDPRTSAQIVISHVPDGLELARKYRLPSAIQAFIPEHQGTGLALSFYRAAVKAAGDDGQGVRPEEFRYPGPRPQSKETAIVMLADSCEARVRSAQARSAAEIEQIVRQTIKAKLDEGELDQSDLTLRDLDRIREAFLDVLQGVFHPRIQYPEPVKVRGPDGREVEV